MEGETLRENACKLGKDDEGCIWRWQAKQTPLKIIIIITHIEHIYGSCH